MKPLVITDADGAVRAAAMTDEKGYRKSLEQGELWTLNPETGRLLPQAGSHRLVSISDEGGWYRAVVDAPAPASGNPAHTVQPKSTSAGPAASAPGPGADSAGAGAGGDVLTRLSEVVRRRQGDMPEGSYTSYLFSSGLDKIRKKTGEEAVELVLARERAEVVSESADLLYHLLVLLRAQGIETAEVLDELASRLDA